MATITGTSGNDLLTGSTTGGDTLVGGLGNDDYVVYTPDTVVVEAANAGTDLVYAWSAYTLSANVENMWVLGNNTFATGNSLDNVITAYGSGNRIIGGGGNDTLINNTPGSMNFFSFNAAEGAGHTTVQGFAAAGVSHDFIQLTDYGFTTFASVQSHLSQVGADTLLTLGAGQDVLFKNVTVASLTASDFLLQAPTPADLGAMTFDDEFNALSLYNLTTGKGTWKTNYFFGSQTGSQEWGSRMTFGTGEQTLAVDPLYQAGASKPLGLDPFSLSNGVVSLTVAKAPAADLPYLNGQQYTEGLLTTEKSLAQEYGYFEMKAALPTNQGLWPAFWLYAADGSSAEIDVMEQVGEGFTHETDHTTDPNSKTTSFATYFPQYNDGKFHTYGVLWTAQSITYYVDGVGVGGVATPSDMHKPMYMIVSMGAGGSWPGQLDPSFTSASMKVDYVHAYAVPGTTYTTSPNIAATTPATPSIAAVSSSSGAVANNGSTTANTVTLSGAALANSTVAVSLDGTVIGQAAVNASGAWTYNATATVLANGAHAFTVADTDVAGNVSANSAAYSFTVNPTVAPSISFTQVLAHDTGASAVDGVTNVPIVTVSGTAE